MDAPLPANEAERLAELRSFSILDSDPEQGFDDLVYIAAQLCDAPIALVTLVDEERQWYKARIGVEGTQTPRSDAFCAHAILRDEPLIVPDARLDPRFEDNPLVTGAPNIRFYAGTPLRTENGHGLGTICVIDTKPRVRDPLTQAQLEVLAALSRQTVRVLNHRKADIQRTSNPPPHDFTGAPVPVCAWCARIREPDHSWLSIAEYLHERLGLEATHGICPDCLPKAGGRPIS